MPTQHSPTYHNPTNRGPKGYAVGRHCTIGGLWWVFGVEKNSGGTQNFVIVIFLVSHFIFCV